MRAKPPPVQIFPGFGTPGKARFRWGGPEHRSARGGWLWGPMLMGAVLLGLAGLGAGGCGAGADRLAERRAKLATMSRWQKAHLLQARIRLEALDPAERQRLRQLNRQIEQDPQAAQLRQTAHRYYAWLKTLPMYRRAELQEMPPPQRVEAIEKALEESARYGIRRPRPQDAEGLWQWMQQYAQRRQAEVLASLPPERQQDCQTDPEHCRRLVMSLLWGPGQSSLPPSQSDLQDLYRYLSPQTRQRLQTLSTQKQWNLIASWARYLVHYQADRATGWVPPEVSEAELLYFFEYELSPEQIDALLALPPEQMLQELRRLYFRIKLPAVEEPTPEPAAAELPFGT